MSRRPNAARRRILWIFAALAVACPLTICAVGYSAFRAWFGSPAADLAHQIELARSEHLPLDPADLHGSPLLPEDNAATVYRGFFPRIDRLFASTRDLRASCQSVIRGEATADQASTTKRAIGSVKESLVEIAAASRRRRCDFGLPYEQGLNLQLPEFASGRNAVRLLLAKAHFDADAGDIDGAFDRLLAAQRVGEHLGQTPILVAMLVQISIEALVMDEFEHLLNKSAGNSRLLVHAQNVLSHFGSLADLRHSLSGEVVLGRIGLHTARNTGDFEMPASTPEPRGIPIPDTLRKAFEAKYVEQWRQIFRDLPKDPEQWTQADAAMRNADARVQADTAPTALVNKILFPVFSEAALAIGREQANRRVAATALLLMRDKLRKGSYPPTLPNYGAVSVDPFDGKPLRYIRTGAGFMIYSIDRDRIDNGGRKRHGDQPGDLVCRFPN